MFRLLAWPGIDLGQIVCASGSNLGLGQNKVQQVLDVAKRTSVANLFKAIVDVSNYVLYVCARFYWVQMKKKWNRIVFDVWLDRKVYWVDKGFLNEVTLMI